MLVLQDRLDSLLRKSLTIIVERAQLGILDYAADRKQRCKDEKQMDFNA